MNLFLPLLNQEDQSHQTQKMIKEAKLQEWNQCNSDVSIANRTSRPLQSLDLPPHLKMKHQKGQVQRMGKFEEDASARCPGVFLHPLQCENGTRTFHRGEGEAHHHRQGAGVHHLLEDADHHLH